MGVHSLPDYSALAEKEGVVVKDSERVTTLSIPLQVSGIQLNIRDLVESRTRLWLNSLGTHESSSLTSDVQARELRYYIMESVDSPKPPAWKVFAKQAPPTDRPRNFNEHSVLIWSESLQSLEQVLDSVGRDNIIETGEGTLLLIGRTLQSVRSQLATHGLLLSQQAAFTLAELREQVEQFQAPELRHRSILPATSANPEIAERIAITRFLHAEMHLEEVWKHLCFIAGQDVPIPPFDLIVEKQIRGGALRFVDHKMELAFTPDDQISIKSVRAMPRIALGVNVPQLYESKFQVERTLVHELAHMLAADCAPNVVIEESIAEAIVQLYYSLLQKPGYDNFAGKMNVLSGDQHPGFNLGDCAESLEFGNLHPCIAWAGASALLECLGKDTAQQIHNMRAVMKASRPSPNQREDQKVVLPTTQEWVAKINALAPSIGTRIQNHPTFQPLTDGKYVLSFRNPTNDGVVIFSMTMKRNPRFGKAFGSMVRHKAPTPEQFDRNPGSVEFHQFNIRIVSSRGHLVTARGEGMMSFTLEEIADRLRGINVRPEIFGGFAVEVEVDGRWQTVLVSPGFTPEAIAALNDNKSLVRSASPDLRVLLGQSPSLPNPAPSIPVQMPPEAPQAPASDIWGTPPQGNTNLPPIDWTRPWRPTDEQ